MTILLKEYLGTGKRSVKSAFPGVVWLYNYPSLFEISEMQALHKHLLECLGYTGYKKTISDGLHVCMMSGNELWNNIWVDRYEQ